MIVVTGGAGFIGSHLVKALNNRGINDILIVDDLTDGIKFKNLVDLDISDYMDKDAFIQKITTNQIQAKSIQAIFHQGACTSTMEWDGKYLMENNFEYSKTLFHYCQDQSIPFIYASSAAIYGNNPLCQENPKYETPLNVYGYTKLIFDRYVRKQFATIQSQVVGLRYFNVYGANETHKGPMKSVVQHFCDELIQNKTITIFDDLPGCKSGEQRRDFVYVEDVVAAVLWFYDNPQARGIFNLGSGLSVNFNTIAQLLIEKFGYGHVLYKTTPASLLPFYQVNTRSDVSKLQEVGYKGSFKTIEEGIEHLLSLKSDLPSLNLV